MAEPKTERIVGALIAIGIAVPLVSLLAQDQGSQVDRFDLNAAIRFAITEKNPEILEKAAAAFMIARQYDQARKLLESAAAIRLGVSGEQSADYGMALMKLANLEKRRARPDADSFSSKALRVLGDRPETAPALLYLGIREKNSTTAFDYLQRAQRADPSQIGPAAMWMALRREKEKKPAEAEELYRSALAAEDPESADAANTMALFGRFLNAQKRESEANDMLARSTAVLTALNLQGAPRTPGPPVYRAGGSVSNPAVLFKVDPEYSPEARLAAYSGSVVCYVEVGTDGVPRNIRIVRGIGLGLDQEALAAVGHWRFKPGAKDGVPVIVAARIEVNFRLF